MESLSLKDVLNNLEAGFYAVPETQRYFVWNNGQVRDLISSIYNFYPIGGIIVWEMSDAFIRDYEYLVRPLSPELPRESMKYLIIDGQQRLTSLLLVKRGSIRIPTPSGEERERRIKLYFNPHTGEFELGRRSFDNDPNWYDVTEVLNAETIYEVLKNKAKRTGIDKLTENPSLIKGLERLRENLSNYQIPFIKARLEYSQDPLELFERISRIYVTINRKGTRIGMTDLVIALVGGRVRRWISFRSEFSSILKDLKDKNFEVREATVMRLYLAIATGKTKFNDAKKELDKMKDEDLLDALRKTKEAALSTVEFLWREAWIPSSEFLQSDYLLVTLSYLLYKDVLSKSRPISGNLRKELIKWLILASVEKRYTGRLETDLSEDISKIVDGKSISGLLSNLRFKSVPPEVLESDSFDEYHLTLLAALYRELQTRDWDLSRLPTIPLLGELEPRELQVHHIFPKDVLENVGKESLADHPANITVISGRANERIRNKPPSRYLKELLERDPELLEKHLVPINEDLWRVENYEEFLKERAKLILQAIHNHFLSIIT